LRISAVVGTENVCYGRVFRMSGLVLLIVETYFKVSVVAWNCEVVQA